MKKSSLKPSLDFMVSFWFLLCIHFYDFVIKNNNVSSDNFAGKQNMAQWRFSSENN